MHRRKQQQPLEQYKYMLCLLLLVWIRATGGVPLQDDGDVDLNDDVRRADIVDAGAKSDDLRQSQDDLKDVLDGFFGREGVKGIDGNDRGFEPALERVEEEEELGERSYSPLTLLLGKPEDERKSSPLLEENKEEGPSTPPSQHLEDERKYSPLSKLLRNHKEELRTSPLSQLLGEHKEEEHSKEYEEEGHSTPPPLNPLEDRKEERNSKPQTNSAKDSDEDEDEVEYKPWEDSFQDQFEDGTYAYGFSLPNGVTRFEKSFYSDKYKGLVVEGFYTQPRLFGKEKGFELHCYHVDYFSGYRVKKVQYTKLPPIVRRDEVPDVVDCFDGI